ncbi:putative minichromosome maintenance protein 10 [Paratrimastix pyriformis]|uniref:Protein MCM10 homolog n=1 Tax=Paratrimastix pyriformis TaxID=342808 RepID=A0ABQ8UQV9_9EUKA|nr:putative minichromosome maintenance protein 10 [Paratrimastix pyriformis]
MLLEAPSMMAQLFGGGSTPAAATTTVSRTSSSAHLPGASRNPNHDSYTGFEISNRVTGPAALSTMLSDVNLISLSRVTAAQGKSASRWATYGVVIGDPRVLRDKRGRNFLIWRLHDLNQTSLSLFTFGACYDMWRSALRLANPAAAAAPSDVFGLATQAGLSTANMPPPAEAAHFNCKEGDVVIVTSPELLTEKSLALSITQPAQLIKVGTCATFGRCKSTKKAGGQCGAPIDTRQGPACIYHAAQALKHVTAMKNGPSLVAGHLVVAEITRAQTSAPPNSFPSTIFFCCDRSASTIRVPARSPPGAPKPSKLLAQVREDTALVSGFRRGTPLSPLPPVATTSSLAATPPGSRTVAGAKHPRSPPPPVVAAGSGGMMARLFGDPATRAALSIPTAVRPATGGLISKMVQDHSARVHDPLTRVQGMVAPPAPTHPLGPSLESRGSSMSRTHPNPLLTAGSPSGAGAIRSPGNALQSPKAGGGVLSPSRPPTSGGPTSPHVSLLQAMLLKRAGKPAAPTGPVSPSSRAALTSTPTSPQRPPPTLAEALDGAKKVPATIPVVTPGAGDDDDGDDDPDAELQLVGEDFADDPRADRSGDGRSYKRGRTDTPRDRQRRELAKELGWRDGLPSSTPALYRDALAEAILKSNEDGTATVDGAAAAAEAEQARAEQQLEDMHAQQRAAAALLKKPLPKYDPNEVSGRKLMADDLMALQAAELKRKRAAAAAAAEKIADQAAASTGMAAVFGVGLPTSPRRAATAVSATASRPPGAENAEPPEDESFVKLPEVDTGVQVLAPRSLIDQMGGLRAVLMRESAHSHEADERKDREIQRTFDMLEAKQAIADKMDSVFQLEVDVFTCRTCGERSGSLIGPLRAKLCREKGHDVAKMKAYRRFFECTKCHDRITVVGYRFPLYPCEKCGSKAFQRASMLKEQSNAILEELICPKVLARGVEYPFSTRSGV